VTYHGNILWADVHHWETFIGDLEAAPNTPPIPTQLHRYRELGTFGPPAATTDVLTNPKHVQVNGSSLDVGASDDFLVGTRWYGEVGRQPPTREPLTETQKGHWLLFDLATSRGGASWPVTRERFIVRKIVWFFDAVNGYHAGTFTWQLAGLLDATEWTADSNTAWALTGERVSVWAVWERPDEPLPGDTFLDGNLADSNTTLAAYNTTKLTTTHLYVSRNGGAAILHTIPLPVGWVETFAIRSLGGQRLRCWWYGHATQTAVFTTGGHFTGTTNSPSQLWRGEGNQDGTDWQWIVRQPITGPGQIVTVSNDAMDIDVSVLTDTVHFVSTHYLSTDAGETWFTLPPPPNWSDGYTYHMLRLVDTP